MNLCGINFLVVLNKIDSTQTLAKKLINNSQIQKKDKILIISKTQYAGRGQKDNKWSSEYGGLYFSFITRTGEKNIKDIQKLSLITAKAIKDTIEKIYNIKCFIKHPNDIYVNQNNKKISGILIETIPYGKIRYIITGIGVNFHNKIPQELKNTATTIYEITKRKNNQELFLKDFFSKYFKLTDFLYEP
ncbi:MAG: biotin--[acetyl-CoA-carboxylase] ligase [Elusimicrobiota bacterium]